MKRLPARVRSCTSVAVSAASSVQMGSLGSCWFRIKTAELLEVKTKGSAASSGTQSQDTTGKTRIHRDTSYGQ